MKRLLLCSLLLVNSWAGACSPATPPQGYLQAVKALNEAKAKQQGACQGFKQIDCTVYDAAPYQVFQWMKVTDSNWQKTGTYWQNFNERYGRLTTIKALGGGTIVRTTDRLTAWEKLEKRLYEMKKTRLPWQNCRGMGLNDAAYHISDCRWVNDSGGRNIFFKVTASTDKSLPSGTYKWADAGTCGYFLRGPIK